MSDWQTKQSMNIVHRHETDCEDSSQQSMLTLSLSIIKKNPYMNFPKLTSCTPFQYHANFPSPRHHHWHQAATSTGNCPGSNHNGAWYSVACQPDLKKWRSSVFVFRKFVNWVFLQELHICPRTSFIKHHSTLVQQQIQNKQNCQMIHVKKTSQTARLHMTHHQGKVSRS